MTTRGLTLKQVAARLGSGYFTAYRLVTSGALVAYKAGGWRVDECDLEAFIAKKKAEQAPASPRVMDDPDERLGPVPEEYRL